MRLTTFTDFSLRTLMYLAMNRERLVTVQDIADDHGIARNHLTKVVHHLGQLGYVATLRGRNGGLRLACEPETIRIGEVVRHTESDFHMAACFDPESAGCMYSAACALKGALVRAAAAFMAELDAVTLADMVAREAPKKGRHGAVPGELKAVVLHRKKPNAPRK